MSLWPEKEGTTIGIYEGPHGTVTQHCITLLLVCSCVHSLFPHREFLLPELGNNGCGSPVTGAAAFGKRWTLLMLEFAVSLTFQTTAVLGRSMRIRWSRGVGLILHSPAFLGILIGLFVINYSILTLKAYR